MLQGELIGINSNPGLMARTVEPVRLGYELLLRNPEAMARNDYKVAPIPWNRELASTDRKLTFGW